MSEQEMGAFFRGQHLGAVTAGAHLTTIHDFSHFRHMLDVGGGSGGISIGACRSCPQLISTVVDLPRVIPVARKFLDESEVADRVTPAVADVVTGSPEGTFDVAVMRNLIQVLSLQGAQAAVCNVAQCLVPGGMLFIVGGMLDDSHRSPVHLVGQNLVHLNIYDDGLIYTEGEYRSLLVGSGFADIEVRREGMPNNQSLVSARKPGEAA